MHATKSNHQASQLVPQAALLSIKETSISDDASELIVVDDINMAEFDLAEPSARRAVNIKKEMCTYCNKVGCLSKLHLRLG